MSNADEILKLKELLDSKIITEEEFEKKKKELLDIKGTIETPTQKANNSKKGFLNKLGIENNITLTSKKNKGKKKKKTSPKTIILLLLILGFIIVVGSSTDKKYEKIEKEQQLFNQYSISYDKVKNVLQECGYNTYFPNFNIEKSADNEEIPGSVGFTIKSGQQIVGFIDIKNNEIENIQYSDKILYQNGAVQHTLSEYIISDDEQIDLITKTEENIKSVLKSPSTAKFPWPDEWKMSKKDGSIIVQSYVDAENSFGTKTRSNFQVTYTNSTITSLIFDGVEYIK